MARKCTVCTHKHRVDIESALVRNESYNAISARFGISEMSLSRHKNNHLPKVVLDSIATNEHPQVGLLLREAAAKEARERLDAEVTSREADIKAARQALDGETVMSELGKCIERVRLLCDACDEYLRDPDDPAKYNVGPRDSDVTVIYMEPMGGDGKLIRRKRKLSEIISDLEQRAGIVVKSVEVKHTDIRELIIKGIGENRTTLGFLVDLQILDHNVRQSELFAEKLFSFLDEQEPGLARKFLEHVRDEKLMRQAVSLPGRAEKP